MESRMVNSNWNGDKCPICKKHMLFCKDNHDLGETNEMVWLYRLILYSVIVCFGSLIVLNWT